MKHVMKGGFFLVFHFNTLESFGQLHTKIPKFMTAFKVFSKNVLAKTMKYQF